MSLALRPTLRAALITVVAAVSFILLAGLMPAPASAAALTPGTKAYSLKVLGTAAKLKGRPYRYGAQGPRAFDCSGFTGYVMRQALGKRLPRSSRAQYAATKRIRKSSARPGDLVFFARRGRVYHVGIYAGGGRVWHSPRAGSSVRLERIWTSGWAAGRVR